MKDEKSKPTRRALSAHAWGEPVPSTEADVKKLAIKGTKLLEKYHEVTDGKKASVKKSSAKRAPAKRTATK